MVNNRDILEEMLAELEKKLKSANMEIKECPAGSLSMVARGERETFFQVKRDNGKRLRRSINKEPNIVRSLARKKYLQAEIAVLDHDILVLRRIIDEYKEAMPTSILKEIKGKLCSLPDEYFLTDVRTLTATSDVSQWENKAYERSNYKEENKIHVTSRGLRVRSKSELMIAEKLYENMIPFHYEEVFHIGEQIVVPDFTILNKEDQMIYWEHCGLTNNETYMMRHKKKMALYERVGIVPWENLIVTYDNQNGNINMGIIESEIRNKLL